MVPVLVLFAAPWVQAAESKSESKYEVLSKTLAPYVSVFAKQSQSGNRAITLRLRLEQMTGLPAELVGTEATVQVQYPDRLRLHGPVFGETLTICRNGQDIWVAPGSRLTALLESAVAKKKLPPLDPKYRLGPIRIPVSDKQLVFFPALFQIEDLGMIASGNAKNRVLDVKIMPELAKALSLEGWIARMYIGEDHRLTRLALVKQGFEAVLVLEEAKLEPSLPDATWQPTAEQAGDLMKIPASRYQQVLKLLGGGSPAAHD